MCLWTPSAGQNFLGKNEGKHLIYLSTKVYKIKDITMQ